MTRPPMLDRLGSFAFYGVSMLWTLGLGVFYLVLFLLPRRYLQNCGAFYCRGLLAILHLTTGLRHEVRGREHLPRTPCIVAAKHQSAWETLALPTMIERPSIVLKRSLYRIPVFGWYLRATGMIGIDRAGRSRALRLMVQEARRAVAEGRPILIFPEGTRTAPGASRGFHVGVSALYERLDLPVVPVALNSGYFWPRDSMRKRPGRIVVEFLPPIPAGLPRGEMADRLFNAINEASDRLLAEAQRAEPDGISR